MIIMLIAFAILVVGVTLSILSKKKTKMKYDTRYFMDVLGGVLCVIGGGFLAAALLFSVLIPIATEPDYLNKTEEKQMLEYRISIINDDKVGNEQLYKDIIEFNNGIRETKYWANNPWTNLFNNQKIANIDCIDYVRKEVDEQ